MQDTPPRCARILSAIRRLPPDTLDGLERESVCARFRPSLSDRNVGRFESCSFSDWCEEQKIDVRYIQPGTPDQNAYIERFNRTYRSDVLNAWLLGQSQNCKISATNGSKTTTLTGRTIHWAAYRRPSSCRGPLPGESLVLKCVLDGDAYARTTRHR